MDRGGVASGVVTLVLELEATGEVDKDDMAVEMTISEGEESE